MDLAVTNCGQVSIHLDTDSRSGVLGRARRFGAFLVHLKTPRRFFGGELPISDLVKDMIEDILFNQLEKPDDFLVKIFL